MSEVLRTADEISENEAPRVRLTDAAVRWVEARRAKLNMPNAALRIGVKGGGCEGYTYVTDLTEDPPDPKDYVCEFSGLRVYVNHRSLRFLDGSVVDAKNTLMAQGLQFDNPQQSTTCGCGATFSIKT